MTSCIILEQIFPSFTMSSLNKHMLLLLSNLSVYLVCLKLSNIINRQTSRYLSFITHLKEDAWLVASGQFTCHSLTNIYIYMKTLV